MTEFLNLSIGNTKTRGRFLNTMNTVSKSSMAFENPNICVQKPVTVWLKSMTHIECKRPSLDNV
uniref:Uncharacterized protein n=1 Tax=Romanomermis culicivorax TaxID=13658 RepID=A0A915JIW3_ROMCU